MNMHPQLLLTSLADTTRLRLMTLLAEQQELCVCELVKALDTQQPKVSKHLAILRSNDLIIGRRQGHWIYYRLNPELPVWARDTLAALVQGCQTRSPFREDRLRLADHELEISCA